MGIVVIFLYVYKWKSLLGAVTLTSSYFFLPPGYITVPSNNKEDGTFPLYKSYFILHSFKETEIPLFWFWMLTKDYLFFFFLLNGSSILEQTYILQCYWDLQSAWIFHSFKFSEIIPNLGKIKTRMSMFCLQMQLLFCLTLLSLFLTTYFLGKK